MKEQTFDGWIEVFQSGTDYEAEMVRDRLDSNGIEAVVLSKRDHAFNLNVGAAARVYVLVPPDMRERALTELASPPIGDSELDQVARDSDPGVTGPEESEDDR